MHLTLRRSQKANTAGKTSIANCGKKGANGAWVHIHFQQHVTHQRAASASLWHSKHGAGGSAAVEHAVAPCTQPLGSVWLTTVLETIAGPLLQWHRIARNEQYQNWTIFIFHLWLNLFWESVDVKVALTLPVASAPAAPGSEAGDKPAATSPLLTPEFWHHGADLGQSAAVGLL